MRPPKVTQRYGHKKMAGQRVDTSPEKGTYRTINLFDSMQLSQQQEQLGSQVGHQKSLDSPKKQSRNKTFYQRIGYTPKRERQGNQQSPP